MRNKKQSGIIQPKTYLRHNREYVFSWEVQDSKGKIPRTGIRNLTHFCEVVGLDEKFVRIQIKSARENNVSVNMVTIPIKNGVTWHIYWKDLDDFRAMCESANIEITKDVRKINGKVYNNPADFSKDDLTLEKLIAKFGGE